MLQRNLRVLLLQFTLLVASTLSAQEVDIAAQEEAAMSAAVDRVAASVVRIETFGGLERIGQVLLGDGPTTGLIVSEDGFILSSAFNFIRQPNSILVTLPEGKRTAAKIVARDHSRMLVLLKVEHDKPLPVTEMVPTDEIQVGQWAIAVGRVYDPKRPNMSVGVLSAKDRIWGKAIQTDAKISPSNYGGPLVDIRGRVFGVLVPMSPNATSEIAGVEWYDSGIGFAIPMADLQPRLEQMKAGTDVHPGLMGITLEGGSVYSKPPIIAACQAKSPAYEAGLRSGDLIVSINGGSIKRQSELKHALGRLYAGDTVHVVVKRGDESIEADIQLVEKLIPYEHPFIGILPRRDGEGTIVRYVYPGSPAEVSGIQAGDRFVAIDDQQPADAAAWRLAAANFEPQQKVAIRYQRGGESRTAELALGSLPTSLPEKLPASRDRQALAEDAPQAKFTEIKIAEEPNECLALVPPTYGAAVPHGVVVYLRAPGDFDRDKLLAKWHQLCSANDLILLAPQPRDKTRWTPPELDFIRKTVDHVVNNYTVDRSRIVMLGREAGGALGYLFAFRHRDLARAVIAVDAATPVRVRLPDNDPVQRLAVVTTLAQNSPVAPRVEQGIERLRKMKYPVTVMEMGKARDLTAEELEQVVRWIDTLDRI
jgi:serine protease Do